MYFEYDLQNQIMHEKEVTYQCVFALHVNLLQNEILYDIYAVEVRTSEDVIAVVTYGLVPT